MGTAGIRDAPDVRSAGLSVGPSEATAAWTTRGSSGDRSCGAPAPGDTTLTDAFRRVDRNTSWQLTHRLRLTFPTFHPQGIAFSSDHIFLSAVEILEGTVEYPSLEGGHDRSPGRGTGHLFVMDLAGDLLHDITLGSGARYHPGGIDFDGTSVWVPVAEYRPNSSAIIYRVDATTLRVHHQFTVDDHCGAVVMDRQSGHLVGTTWGSRRFAEWNPQGIQLRSWQNPTFFVDYQDGQYIPDSKALCAGTSGLPNAPGGRNQAGSYELGGIALIDLRTQDVLHDVPFQRWSTAGHVATRNPFAMAVSGDRLTMRVAPDDGDEGNGTEILTYESCVAPGHQAGQACRNIGSAQADRTSGPHW